MTVSNFLIVSGFPTVDRRRQIYDCSYGQIGLDAKQPMSIRLEKGLCYEIRSQNRLSYRPAALS